MITFNDFYPTLISPKKFQKVLLDWYTLLNSHLLTFINVEVGVFDLMLIISFQLRLWMNIPTVMQYIVPLRTVVIRFVLTDLRPKH